MDKSLKPGDHVVMVGCIEADSHLGDVWEVKSDPWTLGGSEVVLLHGFSGAFTTECLLKTDKPIYHPPKPINPDFVAFEKMFRATQQVTQEEFVDLVTDFFGNGDRDYAEGCWSQWCQSPIGYIYSRNPLEQGEKLFELLQKKTKGKDIADHCYSVHEKYYQRFKE